MLKIYDPTALAHLAALIRGEKSEAEWLRNNGYPELAEFWDAYFGIEKSFKWLLDNGFRHFAAAIDAAGGKDTAKLWLITNGYRELALFVSAAEGDKTAVALLMKSNYKDWVGIAHDIFEYNKKTTRKGIWNLLNFGNPFG